MDLYDLTLRETYTYTVLHPVKKVYAKFPAWLRDDIFTAASIRANFFEGPSAS